VRSPSTSAGPDVGHDFSRPYVRDNGGELSKPGVQLEDWPSPNQVPDGLRTMGLPIFVDGTQMGEPEASVSAPEPVWRDTDPPELGAED
jgi:hypothetical protein